MDFKLEVVTLPVTDVDRAKTFYQGLENILGPAWNQFHLASSAPRQD